VKQEKRERVVYSPTIDKLGETRVVSPMKILTNHDRTKSSKRRKSSDSTSLSKIENLWKLRSISNHSEILGDRRTAPAIVLSKETPFTTTVDGLPSFPSQ
jgi:hypothetical protein